MRKPRPPDQWRVRPTGPDDRATRPDRRDLRPFGPGRGRPDRNLPGVDGFTVPVEAVATAADAAGRVAAAVTPVDLSGPVRALAAALPGSRTALTAGGAGVTWAAELPALAVRIGRHADAMAESARAYGAADAAFAARMPVPGGAAAGITAGLGR
jgi:hypothetical protein